MKQQNMGYEFPSRLAQTISRLYMIYHPVFEPLITIAEEDGAPSLCVLKIPRAADESIAGRSRTKIMQSP